MMFYLKQNWKYILAAVLCFFLIPHIPQLCFPDYYHMILENGNTPMRLGWDIPHVELMFLLHNYCIYLIPPLFAGILGLAHVRREEAFCPILSLLAFLSPLTFLLWDTNTWAALTMLVSAASLTIVDAVGLFTRFDGDAPQPGGKRFSRLLWGAAQNASFLALMAFWLVAIPICFQVYFTVTVAGDFDSRLRFAFMVYAPFAALVLPLYHEDDKPMTTGGMLVATVIFLLSAVICACVDTCRFRRENMILLGVSYLMFALLEGAMALYRRHKAKKIGADDSPA